MAEPTLDQKLQTALHAMVTQDFDSFLQNPCVPLIQAHQRALSLTQHLPEHERVAVLKTLMANSIRAFSLAIHPGAQPPP
ncbi:MAG TPA: hypothetical protein VNI01_02280 [Elusimicrobiota bacterium]|jgi:hypothetical protein|nr:hypothetical protein [Elusimicrobiota bacterium]